MEVWALVSVVIDADAAELAERAVIRRGSASIAGSAGLAIAMALREAGSGVTVAIAPHWLSLVFTSLLPKMALADPPPGVFKAALKFGIAALIPFGSLVLDR